MDGEAGNAEEGDGYTAFRRMVLNIRLKDAVETLEVSLMATSLPCHGNAPLSFPHSNYERLLYGSLVTQALEC